MPNLTQSSGPLGSFVTPGTPAVQRAKGYVTFAIAAGIIAATMVIFSRGIWTPFFNYDDPIYVMTNPHVKSGLSADGFKWALWAGIRPDRPYDCGNWHPLTWLSLQADATLWGPDDFRGFHLTSIVLHAINAALVFLFLQSATSRTIPSLLVALFFAWHPLRVESVTWISERKDVLSAFFFLLTLLAYRWYAQSPQPGRYLLVAVLFAAGLAAKPMVITLPVLLLLIDYWPLRRFSAVQPAWTGAVLFLEKVPLLVLSASSSVITVIAQRASGAMEVMEHFTLPSRLLNAGIAYIQYLWTMIWPFSLAPLYPLPAHISVLAGLLAWLAIIVLTFAAIRAGKRRPWVPAGWLWYLIMLLPVLGLVQVGYQSRADRYTYLPMLGVLMAIAFNVGPPGVWHTSSPDQRAWPRVTTFAVCLALGLLATATWRQQGYWENSLWLWQHTIDLVGPDPLIEYQAGEACQRQQSPDLAGAEFHYRNAMTLAPTYADPYVNLGSVLLCRHRPADALIYLEKAVHLKPDLVGAHRNLGLALLRLKRYEEAAAQYRQEVQLDPTNPEMLELLGMVESNAGHHDAAFESFARAARIRPHQGLYFAECAHERGFGHQMEARQIYGRSFQVDPQWARDAAQEALELLSAADPADGDDDLAFFLAEIVCEATERTNGAYLDLLSRAQAAKGEYAKAALTMQEAIEAEPQISIPKRRQWSEQLRHYRNMQNQPLSATAPGKMNSSP